MAKRKETPEQYEQREKETRDLENSAIAGNAVAQDRLAARLAQGYFVEQDEAGALYWYCQAIKQGYSDSKWNAGTMIEAGEGGAKRNSELAMRLMEEAAEAGQPSACLHLIYCHTTGFAGKEIDQAMCRHFEERYNSPTVVEFSEPLDLERDHGIVVHRPVIVYKKFRA